MADLARAEQGRSEEESEGGGAARSEERSEGRARSQERGEGAGRSEEGGARRGRRAEAREERGGTRERGARSKKGKKGATRSDLDSQNMRFCGLCHCKTTVWLRFPSENAAKPWFGILLCRKTLYFKSPKCLWRAILNLLGPPWGRLGGPLGYTWRSRGTQGLQTRVLEVYMCVLYGKHEGFKHAGTQRNPQKLNQTKSTNRVFGHTLISTTIIVV